MSSWIRSSKRGKSSRGMSLGEHGDGLRLDIGRLLARDDTKLRVAHDPRDDDQLYGWLCWSASPSMPVAVVHYAYTKLEHRRRDVMRRLAAEAGLSASSSVVYTTRSPQTPHVIAKLTTATEFYPLATFLAPPRP